MSLIPKQILQIAIGEEYRKIIPLDKLRNLFDEIDDIEEKIKECETILRTLQ